MPTCSSCLPAVVRLATFLRHTRRLAKLQTCAWALLWALGAQAAAGCALLGGRAEGAYERAAKARGTGRYQKALAQAVQARIDRLDPALHVGVHVLDAADGHEVFAHNARERFVPASTVKLLTAATALDVLGPAFRFSTELWADGYERDSKTVRNLYLRGSGDPSLEVGDLAELVAVLKQAGIRRIVGEVVIDDTAFDQVPWGRGWMWDDLGDGFSAPVSALNVAGNALSLWVAPGTKVGGPARTFMQPWTRYITLIDAATTTAAGSNSAVRLFLDGDDGSLEGPPLTPDLASASFGPLPAPAFTATDLALVPGHHVTVGGGLGLDAIPRVRRFAVRDAAAWVATLLREQLLAQKLEVPANWRRGATPPGAQVMASHASASLASLLPGYVKASDNHALECLLKRVGAQTSQQPGSFASGVQAVRRYVEAEAGADGSAMVLLDGSGASRYDLLTPQQLTGLTWKASQSFVNGPEFVASLPIGGTDGTLSHRMRSPALHNQVRAKTGTMTGVSSLCGLLHTGSGEQLVFAIMVDHATSAADGLRALQDDLLQMLQMPAEKLR